MKTKNIAFLLSFVMLMIQPLSVRANLFDNYPYFRASVDEVEKGAFTPCMTTDPSEIQFYISSLSAFSAYVTYVNNGVLSWNSTALDINLTRTTSYGSSQCDIRGFSGNVPNTSDMFGVLGYTTFTIGEGPYSGNNEESIGNLIIQADSHYWLAEIYISYDNNPASELASSTAMRKQVTAVAAHEMGHALGMSHSTNTGRVMYSPYTSTSKIAPINDEKREVRILYDYQLGGV